MQKESHRYSSIRGILLTTMILVPFIPFILIMGLSFYSLKSSLEKGTITRMSRVVDNHRQMIDNLFNRAHPRHRVRRQYSHLRRAERHGKPAGRIRTPEKGVRGLCGPGNFRCRWHARGLRGAVSTGRPPLPGRRVVHAGHGQHGLHQRRFHGLSPRASLHHRHRDRHRRATLGHPHYHRHPDVRNPGRRHPHR